MAGAGLAPRYVCDASTVERTAAAVLCWTERTQAASRVCITATVTGSEGGGGIASPCLSSEGGGLFFAELLPGHALSDSGQP